MRLVITGEDGGVREALLERDEAVIGRSAESDVRLEDRDVSRRHARLLRDGLEWFVEDLGSGSGTRVDGALVVGRRRLTAGESLAVGGYVLMLRPDEAELPTLPPHPARSVPPSSRQVPAVRPQRRFPTLVVLALLIVAGGAGWFWNVRRVRATRCLAAQVAFENRNWAAAAGAMRALRYEGIDCPGVDLAELAAKADLNLAASKALEEGRRQLGLHDWEAALATVTGAPAGTALAGELRQVEADARRGRADALAAALEAALAASDVMESERLLALLSSLGLDERLLAAWRDRLTLLKEGPPTVAPSSPAPPAQKQAPRPADAESPPPENRRPLAERDAEARRLYEAAGNDIRASDMLGAVDKLQLALETAPSRSLRCQVLRSLGVAFARSGKKVETARTYRAYLDCDPKARDREQLERVIREARP
jgi:hypothetical protein